VRGARAELERVADRLGATAVDVHVEVSSLDAVSAGASHFRANLADQRTPHLQLALDGSPLAAQVIEPTHGWAQALGAETALVRVLPPAKRAAGASDRHQQRSQQDTRTTVPPVGWVHTSSASARKRLSISVDAPTAQDRPMHAYLLHVACTLSNAGRFCRSDWGDRQRSARRWTCRLACR